MESKSFFRNPGKMAKMAILIIFLALIRSISEPFRLQYYSKTVLTYHEIKPFLIGSLVAAVGLLGMTLLFYFGKNKLIIATCILTIILLLLVKKIYLMP